MDSPDPRELLKLANVKLPEATKALILTLHKEGKKPTQISKLLGVPRHKIRSVIDPAYRNPRKQILSRAQMAKDEPTTIRERAVMSERDKKFDPDATADDCIADLRTVQEDNPDLYIHRWRYMLMGQYSEATWNRFFGTFHEFRRQAGLELSRYQHQHERHIAKHASVDHYRNFYNKEVKPYVGQYPRTGKSKDIYTLLAASDFHDVDCDEFALHVFLDTAKRLQPDVILLNGDVFDLYEFSRFSVDPRLVSVRERFDFVSNHIFKPLREACPDSQIDFLLGNHEWRLLKHMADRTPNLPGLLSDVMGLTLEDIFRVREYEINLHCKWDLAAWGKKPEKEQLKQNYIVYWNCFVASHLKDFGFGMSGTSGHTHKPDTNMGFSMAMGGPIFWTTTGCMRRVDEEYVMGINKHVNGFALFHIQPRTREVIPENIIITPNSAAVAGVYYHRP